MGREPTVYPFCPSIPLAVFPLEERHGLGSKGNGILEKGLSPHLSVPHNHQRRPARPIALSGPATASFGTPVRGLNPQGLVVDEGQGSRRLTRGPVSPGGSVRDCRIQRALHGQASSQLRCSMPACACVLPGGVPWPRAESGWRLPEVAAGTGSHGSFPSLAVQRAF